jgi:hypothetical protein
MLVETSNHKTPYQYELGTSEDIMTISPTGNGHVARNIRLALLAMEFVQPYVIVQSVNGVPLSDDIVPLVRRDGTTCQSTKLMAVPQQDDTTSVTIQWTVGGAVTVDETSLHYVKWDTKIETLLDCEEPPDWDQLRPLLHTGTMTSTSTGTTQFGSHNGKFEGTIFSATIDLSKFTVEDRIAIIAVARVDQDWGTATDPITDRDIGPPLGPQSHVVNARTNPHWYHRTTDGSKVIQGRLDWVSVPVTIVLKDYTNIDPVPAAEELSLRFDKSEIPSHDNHSDATNSSKTSGAPSNRHRSVLPIVFISLIVVTLMGYGSRTYLQHTLRYTHRERVREYIQDEQAITPGLQQVMAADVTTNTMKRFSDHDVTDDEADRANGVELGTYT